MGGGGGVGRGSEGGDVYLNVTSSWLTIAQAFQLHPSPCEPTETPFSLH